ncbi:MAG: hypothetical protein ABF536_09245 [Liquorilactobacillus mali]
MDDDLPAWALQVAAEQMGYEQFADVPENRMGECLELAEFIA